MGFKDVQVSVVIPSYNRAVYVTMAIKSVLDQSYQDYEIIVVDDGSTDGTRAALEPYRDRISYIYQDNKGVSTARNVGIQKAKGEWVAFLDSDDEWLPNKLEIQMKHIKNHPNICIHVANVSLINPCKDNTNLFCVKGFDKIAGEFLLLDRPLTYLLQYNFVYPSAALVRKTALINAGLFDKDLLLHEDTDLFYRIALEGQWGICGLPMVKKFRREEPAMINLSERHTSDPSYTYKVMVKIMERLQPLQKLTRNERGIVKRFLSNYTFMVGVKLKAERKGGAHYWFYNGFRAKPSVKTFIKWLILSFPFGEVLIDPEQNRSKK